MGHLYLITFHRAKGIYIFMKSLGLTSLTTKDIEITSGIRENGLRTNYLT